MADPRFDRLRRLLREKACRFGAADEFVLASGQRSDAYVDGKLLTLSSAGAGLVAELLWERIAAYRPDAVGGVVIGADPIIGALLAYLSRVNLPLTGFLVRKEAKGHGTRKSVEGPRPAVDRPRVVTVDDVVTTGASTLVAIQRVRQEWSADVLAAVAIVDREAGAAEAFAAEGVKFHALFKLSELREAAPS